MPSIEPRRRLADLMDDRRIELDLAWEDVARRAGVTGMTLRRVRNNESAPPRRTAHKIDRALEWEPGSVEAILTGGEPTPVPLTEEQQELMRTYRAYLRKHGPAEAKAMLRLDVERINDTRESGERAG